MGSPFHHRGKKGVKSTSHTVPISKVQVGLLLSATWFLSENKDENIDLLNS